MLNSRAKQKLKQEGKTQNAMMKKSSKNDKSDLKKAKSHKSNQMQIKSTTQ